MEECLVENDFFDKKKNEGLILKSKLLYKN